MAQSAGAVALDIVLGKNTVSGVARQAAADVQRTFSDASAGIGSKVSAVGQACTTMGGALMPVSTAVTTVGKSAVQTAANFESAMSEVAAISGATGSDFDKLKDKAQEMGAKTKFSASQSAEAMTYMAMAGWKTEDMLSGIEGMMNLAAASGEDLATTSDIVTDALTAFGKSAKDSGELADIMAAASSNANTNVGMMGETFKYAAPVAGALGYTMQDTALAIGLMANAGIKGSQAGTSLRSMFTRLASPPKECAEAMEELGISITNADGTMKPFREVIDDLRVKFSSLSEAEQAQYAKALAGQEAMSGLLAIVNAAPADVDKLTTAIDNSNGAAEKMATTMNDNLNGRLTLLKSQLEGVAIEIGESLMPIIDKCIEVVSKFADWFSKLDDNQKQTIITIGLVVAAGAPLLIIVGKVISGIGSIISFGSMLFGGISSLIGGIGGLTGGLGGLAAAFNPVTLAIGAVVGAGAVLIANWESIKEVAGFVKEKVGEAWNNLKEKTVEAWNNIKEKTSEAWSAVKEKVSGLVTGVKDKVSETWNNIKSKTSEAFNAVKSTASNIWSGIKNTVSNLATGAKNAVSNCWNGIKNATSTIFNGTKNFISNCWSGIKNTVSTLANGAKTAASTAWNGIKSATSTIFNGVKSVVSTAWSGIKNTVSNLANGAKNAATNAWNGIKNGISTAGSKIKESVTNCFNGAKDKIKGFASEAVSWGADFANGLANGIKGAASSVIDAAKSLGSKIKSFLHFSRPDEGPLRDYETWMPDFVQGMANGIESNKYKLVNAVKGMAGEMALQPATAPALKNVSYNGVMPQADSTGDNKLYALLTQLIANMQNMGDITIPVYLGNDLLDERIVKANDRRTVRSGGRA